MRPVILFLQISLIGSGVAACPKAPDHSEQLALLFKQVQGAQSEQEARNVSNQMWELWTQAPDEVAQEILDRGMSRRSGYDYAGALIDFNVLVEYCPNYAEGCNQRAFVDFLRQDFNAALIDLDRTLELSPDHVGALSGQALSLLALNRIDEARRSMARALELNLWLPERGLAGPGGPLEPPGKDI